MTPCELSFIFSDITGVLAYVLHIHLLVDTDTIFQILLFLP
jgi:hypothetical protein